MQDLVPYRLIVQADPDAWKRQPTSLSRDRFGEHTADAIRARVGVLDVRARVERCATPAQPPGGGP